MIILNTAKYAYAAPGYTVHKTGKKPTVWSLFYISASPKM
jgi:hypothetical protein